MGRDVAAQRAALSGRGEEVGLRRRDLVVQPREERDRGRLQLLALAACSQLPSYVQGMTSGGTRPATRSITKNGAPSGPGSSSSQITRGTGRSLRSRTSRMVRYCAAMS